MTAQKRGAVLILSAGIGFAQQAANTLTFEVASIRPSPPDAPGGVVRPLGGGGLRMTGATLKNVIAYAYGVREFLISAGPGWVETERFDIEGRMGSSPGETAPAKEEQRERIERLRSLLADRFQLAFHRETREQPAYVLVTAKGGPKFHESAETNGRIRMYRATISGHAVGVGLLALNLSNVLERRVIDKTGLSGKYDFELKWAPEAAPLPDADPPSLFTALYEQLGLRLESQKAPVELFVIDAVEKPTEN